MGPWKVGGRARQARPDDRATGKNGEAQPETLPFNELGINGNVIPRFQVEVL
jgi:hypothetical protein